MREIIFTEKAPAAIGPYSQANKVGDFIFASGQIPVNPQTGEIPEGIEAQTKQALENVKAILETAGASMEQVIKTTCFIKNMDDFVAMNGVYATFFKEGSYPSRSAVEVARLPKDVLVEVEVIAYIG